MQDGNICMKAAMNVLGAAIGTGYKSDTPALTTLKVEPSPKLIFGGFLAIFFNEGLILLAASLLISWDRASVGGGGKLEAARHDGGRKLGSHEH